MAALKVDMTKEGKRRYRVRVRCNGQYASATRGTKKEARRWADRVERQFCLNRLSPLGQSEILTIGELIDKYDRQVMPWKKPQTQRQQRQQLDWWRKFLGNQALLIDIDAPAVSLAKEVLLPRSAKTINRYLAALSHVFTKGVKEWRCVEVNPVLSVERLPEGQARTRWLRAAERKSLLFACRSSQNKFIYPVVIIGLSTGARLSEIRFMRWDAVDLYRTMKVDGRTVEVGRYYLEKTKTDEARALVFHGEALKLLRKLHRNRTPGNPWCFPSDREAHKPIDFRYAWEQARLLACLENFCFHDLRHSAASYLGEQGASLAEIGYILGHKNQATTKKYTHFTNSSTEHLITRMNQSVFGRLS